MGTGLEEREQPPLKLHPEIGYNIADCGTESCSSEARNDYESAPIHHLKRFVALYMESDAIVSDGLDGDAEGKFPLPNTIRFRNW